MPDQTADHLSQAVTAANKRAMAEHHFHPYDRITRTIIETPEVATYYEDKGRAALSIAEEKRNAEERDLRQTFQRLYDEKDAELKLTDEARAQAFEAEEAMHDRALIAEKKLAAAEDKGRSEERERLQSLAPHEVGCNCEEAGEFDWQRHEEGCPRREVGDLLASLDTDQEVDDA